MRYDFFPVGIYKEKDGVTDIYLKTITSVD
jgi:hypothetical protein